MKITLLATNGYKVEWDVLKDDTVDSVKLRLFRECSDNLPIPSTVFIEDDSKYTSFTATKSSTVNSNNDNKENNNNDGDKEMKDIVNNEDDENNNNNGMEIEQSQSTVVHPYQIRLLFGGKQLDNFSTLAENNIVDGNTILVAVAPSITLRNILQQQQQQQNRSSEEGSDRLYTYQGAEGEAVPFILSLDDQTTDLANQSPFSKLELLNDKELSDLYVRVPPLEGDNSINGTSNKQVVLHKVKNPPTIKPPRRLSFSSMFSRSSASNNNNNNNNAEKSLELLLDSMTLEEKEKRVSVAVDPVEVMTFTPNGQMTELRRVQVVFSRPFVPLFGDFNDLQVPLEITPVVPNAKWRWLDGITCVYETKDRDAFPGSTSYKVKMSKSVIQTSTYLKDVEFDNQLLNTQEWAFQTAPQLPWAVRFNNDMTNPQLSIEFTQPLPKTLDLTKFITISESTPFSSVVSYTIMPLDEPSAISQCLITVDKLENVKLLDKIVYLKLQPKDLGLKQNYKVNIDKGLSSTLGPLLSTTVSKLTFSTPPPFTIELDKYANKNGQEISLIATHQLVPFTISTYKKDELERMIKIEPYVEITDIKVSGTSLKIIGDYLLGTPYDLVIKDLMSKNGSILAKVKIFDINFPKEKAELQFDEIGYGGPTYNLDPLSKPTLIVNTRGIKTLRITSYEIKIGEFDEFRNFVNTETKYVGRNTVASLTKIPLKPLLTKEVQIQYEPKKRVETQLVLSDFFGSESCLESQYNMLFFAFTTPSEENIRWSRVLQFTPVSINCKESYDEIMVWASNLVAPNQPIIKSSMIVEFYKRDGYSNKLISGSFGSGLNEHGVSKTLKPKEVGLVSVTTTIDKKKFVSVLPFNTRPFKGTKKGGDVILKWEVFNDLGCYRPGDIVNVKGMIRIISEDGLQTPLEYFGDCELSTVKYVLTDNRRKEFFKGKSTLLNMIGSFHISFKLPDEINLGDCKLNLVCDDYEYTTVIKVLECKRKDFLVEYDVKGKLVESVKPNGTPYTNTVKSGEPFFIETTGRSFTDEIMCNTLVNWDVSVSESSPLSLPLGYEYRHPPSDFPGSASFKYLGKRLPSGRHQLRLLMDNAKQCLNLRVTGEMLDVTNRSETFTHSLLVLDNRYRLGVAAFKKIHNIDEEFSTKLIVVDATGKQIENCKIKVSLYLVPWDSQDVNEVLPPKLINTTYLTSQGQEIPTIFQYKFDQRGGYNLEFELVQDEILLQDRIPPHTYQFYVFGPQTPAEKEYKEQTKTVTLDSPYAYQPVKNAKLKSKYPIELKLHVEPFNEATANAPPQVKKPSIYIGGSKSFEIGQELDILVESKLQKGKGYLIKSKRFTVKEVIPFEFDQGCWRLKYTVKESDFPLINFSVYVEGMVEILYNQDQQNGGGEIISETKKDENNDNNNNNNNSILNGHVLKRFTCDFKDMDCQISLKTKTLKVAFDPIMKFTTPNQQAKVSLRVLDHNQKPVPKAEVTVVVADESLLSLSKKTASSTWSPFSQFYTTYTDQSSKKSTLDYTVFSLPPPKKEEPKVLYSTVINLAIRYFSGRILQFKDLPITTTIEKLFAMIQDRDGLPPSSQRLFFQNKQIEKGTLESNHITAPESLMNLVIRLSGGGDDGKEEPMDNLPAIKQIKVRDNFNPLATFKTSQFTDDEGRITVDYQLPDNLTKYRIMAFALTSDSFGHGEEFFTSTLPVMIRQSPPRFLGYMDECIFPVIVQNIVDYDVQVSIAFQSTNCLIQEKGFKAIVKANSRVTVPCSIRALVPNVKSWFHCIVSSKVVNVVGVEGEFCDAVKFSFPVYSPTSLESTCISDVVNNTSKESLMSHPLTIPNWEHLDQESGGLTIDLATDKLSKITPAFKYLMQYKYSCSEQLASKLLSLYVLNKLPHLIDSNPSLRDELFEMDREQREKESVTATGPTKEKIDLIAKEIYQLLEKRLQSDGSFIYWDGCSSVYPYVTLYVYWVLLILKRELGADVPETLLQKSRGFIKGQCNEFSKIKYEKQGLDYLINTAFACYLTKTYLNENSSTVAKKLIDTVLKDHKSSYLDVLVYLITTMPESNRVASIEDNITISASSAVLTPSCSVNRFQSSSRTTAMMIVSMIQLSPQYHLLPKLITGLESYGRKSSPYGGGWYNTQDNCYALYAIHRYCETSKVLDTKLQCQYYLNDQVVHKDGVEVSHTSQHNQFIPIKTIIKNQGEILIEKKGKGPLFYSLTFSYAPRNPNYRPVDDRGFKITRRFLPIGRKEEVEYEDLPDQSITKIKSGAKVKVVIDITVHDLSSFVVIQDHLPAGLEPTHNQGYRQYWYDHMNVRDKGAEVFIDTLYPGTYSFSYNCQAVSFGKFISAPARIEEMYCPTIFGRTKTDFVQII